MKFLQTLKFIISTYFPVLLTSQIWLPPSIVWSCQIDCALFLLHVLLLDLHLLLQIW
uniref:Uncharacterized protein n=1 Tax=Arundo donax TaxID=35708 RepID=A0A0A9DAG7_ARUDO